MVFRLSNVEFFTPPQVAEISDISVSTVRRWIDAGVLPAVRSVGNHRRVAKDDLVAFLKERKLPIPPALGAAKRRVLVIEDDAELLKAMKTVLEVRAPNVKVDTANNATHALILIGLVKPDAVILDGLMPGLDGFEVCRFLKATPETAGIKILGISGDHRSEAKFRQLGVDAYLQKPFSAAVVIEMLRLMGVTESRAGQ